MLASSNAGTVVLGIVGWVILFGLYFLPTIWATSKHHHHRDSIFVINFFLGWTVIGWIVALSMAGADPRGTQQTVPVFNAAPQPVSPTPDWYRSPDGRPVEKWWDGQRWTEHERGQLP
jgi:hypothetical protein